MPQNVNVYTPAPVPALRFASPFHLAGTLWRYRDLIWQFSVRDALGRYRGSYLGLIWSILNPLLMLFIYTVVFRGIFGHSPAHQSEYIRYALWLFCGMALFNIFAECMGRSSGLIVANPNYVRKVVFPVEILPVSILGSALLHACVSFSLLIIAVVLKNKSVPIQFLFFPCMLFPLLCLCLGTGWILSALGVFLRDINYAMSYVTQVLFFMTPIFYQLHDIEEGRKLRLVLYANPLTVIVECTRYLLLPGEGFLDWMWLLQVTVFSIVYMQIGYVFFMKCKKAFADVL